MRKRLLSALIYKDINAEKKRGSSSAGEEASNPPHPILRGGTYLITGFQFALSLRLSNLSEASRVLAFLLLPFHRGFDPSLALVAGGALSVGILLYQFARGNGSPRLGGKWSIPQGSKVDARLLIGSTIFGVGWGLAGICRKLIHRHSLVGFSSNSIHSWAWSCKPWTSPWSRHARCFDPVRRLDWDHVTWWASGLKPSFIRVKLLYSIVIECML